MQKRSTIVVEGFSHAEVWFKDEQNSGCRKGGNFEGSWYVWSLRVIM